MLNDNPKAREINRLKAPLKYQDSKVYDSEGNQLACIESISDLKYVVEPDTAILNDEEILEYAPESKEAAKIRLTRGVGDFSDVLFINDSIPYILGFYYTVAICLAIPVFYTGNTFGMMFILILAILPLVYLYYISNLKQYESATKKQVSKPARNINQTKKIDDNNLQEGLPAFEKYIVEVNELKEVFDEKEDTVRDLIGKRFKPPQITYDRFMTTIDKSHDLFYHEADSAINISRLAVEDTPRVRKEIETKINTLNSIIDQIEDLTNELVINISSDEQSSEDVKSLVDDMENLIGSVKEYK